MDSKKQTRTNRTADESVFLEGFEIDGIGCLERSEQPNTFFPVDSFAWLFKGRTDAYGDDRGMAVRTRVMLSHYEEHLSGDVPIGIYCLLSSGHTAWACIDVDFDDYKLAVAIQELLAEKQINSIIEISRSKGWHVWVFYNALVPALWQRWVYPWIVAELGHPTMETNPKQSGGVELGNYVRLPYPRRHLETKRQMFVIDGELLSLEDGMELAPTTSWRALRSAAFRSPLSPPLELRVDYSPSSSPSAKSWATQRSSIYLTDSEQIIPTGQRDETFYTLAKLLHGSGISSDEAEDVLLRLHREQCEDPRSFPVSSIRNKIRSIWRY